MFDLFQSQAASGISFIKVIWKIKMSAINRILIWSTEIGTFIWWEQRHTEDSKFASV